MNYKITESIIWSNTKSDYSSERFMFWDDALKALIKIQEGKKNILSPIDKKKGEFTYETEYNQIIVRIEPC
jgi:hypothetical protein